jgi:hypothetical protein
MSEQENDEAAFRDSGQYVGRERWKRSMVTAHAGTQARNYAEEAAGKSAFNKAIAFLKIRVFLWVGSYLKSRFGRRVPFPDYTTAGDDNGIYDLAAAPGETRPRRSWSRCWATGARARRKRMTRPSG